MEQNLHEEILVQGLAEGNVSIFDYLFHFHYSGLVVYAMKIVREKTIAEDIVQDLFFKLWRDREKLVINQSIKSYLFTSTKNRCLDFLRHQKVSDKAKDHFSRESDMELINEDNYLVESELKEIIEMAMEKLPEKCKQIFILNKLQGFKPDEIAEKEDISIRTVEGHIGKAFKILRVELQPHLPSYIIALILFS